MLGTSKYHEILYTYTKSNKVEDESFLVPHFFAKNGLLALQIIIIIIF